MSPPRELFLSHAHQDREFASHLAEVLARHGVPSWYSERDIAAQWMDEIGYALDRCDWFAVILTPDAVNSDWVKEETQYWLRHRQYRGHTVPLLVTDCDYRGLAFPLTGIQYVDFRGRFDDGCRDLLRRWGIGLRAPIDWTAGSLFVSVPTPDQADIAGQSDAGADPFNELVGLSATNAGLLVPGRRSTGACSLTVVLKHQTHRERPRIRVVLETPGLAFASTGPGISPVTPTLTASAELGAVVSDVSARNIVIDVANPSSTPQQITLSGVQIWTYPNVRPGSVAYARVSLDGVDGHGLASLGTIGERPLDAEVASAACPTVFVGYNGQPSGMISIVEHSVGLFGSHRAKFIRLRLADPERPDEFGRDRFTDPAWLVVAAGNTKLAAAPGATLGAVMVAGQYCDGQERCLEWEVLSPGIVPCSLLVCGGIAASPLAAGPVNGPRLSLDAARTSGPITAVVEVLDERRSLLTAIAAVVIGSAAPKAQPVVIAGSSPGVAAGGSAEIAGNVTVAYTLPVEAAGDIVSIEIENPDITFVLAPENMRPLITSNATSGHIGRMLSEQCTETRLVFEISSAGNGPALPTFTLSNIFYKVARTALVGGSVGLRVHWQGTKARAVVSYVTNAVVRSAVIAQPM